MRRAIRPILMIFLYVHMLSINIAILYAPVLLVAGLLKGRSIGDARWARFGLDLFYAHACLWRGMMIGALIGLVLYIPSRVIEAVARRDRALDREEGIQPAMVIPLAVGHIVMLAVGAIRFFQMPFPTLFLREPVLYEVWRELITYPKTNYLSAVAAIIVPLGFYRLGIRLHASLRDWFMRVYRIRGTEERDRGRTEDTNRPAAAPRWDRRNDGQQ